MTSKGSSQERESADVADVNSAIEDSQDEKLAASDAASVKDAGASDAAKAKAAKPVKRNQTVAPVRKSDSKKSAGSAETVKKHTGPVLFVKQAIGELKQVYWPTQAQVRQYFVVVLVFVVVVMFFIAGLDWVFNWLVLHTLG